MHAGGSVSVSVCDLSLSLCDLTCILMYMHSTSLVVHCRWVGGYSRVVGKPVCAGGGGGGGG